MRDIVNQEPAYEYIQYMLQSVLYIESSKRLAQGGMRIGSKKYDLACCCELVSRYVY